MKRILRRPSVTILMILVTAVSRAALGDVCPRGMYTASSGLCCQMCPAGEFKVADCRTNQDFARCSGCLQGLYTDVANSASQCSKCSKCAPDEIAELCNATQNTACHCKEGSWRPAPSQPCQPSGLSDGAVAAIALGILLPLLALAGAAVHYHRKRSRRVKRQDHECAKLLVEDKSLHKYLTYLQHQTATIQDYNARPGELVLLRSRFVEPIIVAYHRADEKRQHEFVSRGKRHADIIAALRDERFRYGELFDPSGDGAAPAPKLVVLIGVPGIGKTTMAQMIANQVASGGRPFRAEFRVVVYVQFREVNGFPDTLSLRELFRLLHKSLGDVADRVLARPEEVLLVLDGLDEFKKPLDVANACSDPDERASKEAVFAGLLMRKMLLGASMLLTTRPIAMERLSGVKVDRFSEITGFSRQEIREYVERLCGEPERGGRVYANLENCDNLFHFCYIPAFCHIAGKVVESYLARGGRADGDAAATTMTDLFSKYLYVLVAHHGTGTANVRTTVGALANMALHGIGENVQMFAGGDLRRFGVDLDAVEVQKGTFLGEVFRSEAVKAVKLHTFFHLTIQEYFASLAVYLSDGDGPTVDGVILAMEACDDGRYDIFQRFFCGLASPQSWQILDACLGSPRFSCQRQIVDWLRRSLERLAGPERVGGATTSVKNQLVSLLHCLYELHHPETVREIMAVVEEVDLSEVRLSPPDCATVAFVLRGRAGPLRALNLDNCRVTPDDVRRLQPAVAACKTLSCGGNDLCDDGVALLLNGDPQRQHLEELHLWRCSLNKTSGSVIKRIVTHLKNLKTLVLNENEIGDVGVKTLAEVLTETQGGCLEALRLECCSLTEESGSSLSDILRVCPKLRVLGLEDNELGDRGVALLAEGIARPGGDRSLEELHLDRCSLTDDSVSALRDIITAAAGLKKLMLGDNELSEAAKETLALLRPGLVNFEP